MRPYYTTGGLILLILGILMLSVQSITYFTTETEVGPLGFLAWDVARPHTILISPLAGAASVAAGVVLILTARRATAI